MKKIILNLLALFTLATASTAATIVVQSGSPAVEIKLSGGAVLPTVGSGVVIGYFRGYTTANNSAYVTALGAQTRDVLTYIASNFVPIGVEGADADYGANSTTNPLSLRASGPATTIAGTIDNSTWVSGTANAENANGLVRGTKIFMMVYSGPSLANATELGVFSASTWNISTSAAVNTLSMTLSQVDATTEVYRGSLGSLVLAPIVPEASSSALALLAGLGLMSRRRR